MKYIFNIFFLYITINISFASMQNMDTPENTLFLYQKVQMEMDIKGIRNCLTEEARKNYDKQYLDGKTQKGIEQYRKFMLGIFKMIEISKFELIEKKVISNIEVHLKTKTEFKKPKDEEKIGIFILKLENNKWKIDEQKVERK